MADPRELAPTGSWGLCGLDPLVGRPCTVPLQNPHACLLEESQKEPGSTTAKVHIAEGQELGVWGLLQERGVIDWLPLEKVYKDSRGPFCQGFLVLKNPTGSLKRGSLCRG